MDQADAVIGCKAYFSKQLPIAWAFWVSRPEYRFNMFR
jgi:hypothetical protein